MVLHLVSLQVLLFPTAKGESLLILLFIYPLQPEFLKHTYKDNKTCPRYKGVGIKEEILKKSNLKRMLIREKDDLGELNFCRFCQLVYPTCIFKFFLPGFSLLQRLEDLSTLIQPGVATWTQFWPMLEKISVRKGLLFQTGKQRVFQKKVLSLSCQKGSSHQGTMRLSVTC